MSGSFSREMKCLISLRSLYIRKCERLLSEDRGESGGSEGDRLATDYV